MRPLTKRERLILFFCLILISVFAGVHLLFKPFKEKSSELDNKIESKQKLLNKQLKLIRRAKSLEKEYALYFEQFRQEAPNEQVMSSMLSEIEKSAAEFQLRISDLKPRRVKKEDYYNRFSVSLSIDSDFISIIKFLYALQKEPHLFDIDEINFEKAPQRESNNIKSRLVLSRVLILK